MKKFDYKRLLTEAFLLSFINFGFFILIVSFSSEYSSDISVDSQTYFFMSIACFTAYVYMNNIFFNQQEGKEVVKTHIYLVFKVLTGLFLILFVNNLLNQISGLSFLDVLPKAEGIISFLISLGSELDPFRYMIYLILFIYFFCYLCVLFLLLIFERSRFILKDTEIKIETPNEEEEE